MGPSPPAVRDEVTQPPPGGASSRLCTQGSDLEHVTIERRKASLQTLPGEGVVVAFHKCRPATDWLKALSRPRRQRMDIHTERDYLPLQVTCYPAINGGPAHD